MSTFSYWIIGLIWMGSSTALSADPKGKAECIHTKSVLKCVRYIKNYDGDTFTVDIPGVHAFFGEGAKVRVRGIDSPEIKGQDSCEKQVARNARRLTESLLRKAKQIDLENLDRDKYFRILADVRVDGRLLSEILLKNRLAVPYTGKKKARIDWCRSP